MAKKGKCKMNLQQTVLNLVIESAIEQIATTHHTTIDIVKYALEAKNDIVVREFQFLCNEGWRIAADQIKTMAAVIDSESRFTQRHKNSANSKPTHYNKIINNLKSSKI